LQHVIDPDKFIEVAKKTASVIRYFEPVNTDISDCHPHAFGYTDFERWFGDFIIYPATEAINFHTHECIYGTYDNH